MRSIIDGPDGASRGPRRPRRPGTAPWSWRAGRIRWGSQAITTWCAISRRRR